MQAIQRWRETGLTIGTLFLTTGTLLCCAIPILLVSLGLGTLVAGMIGAAPWLITLSQYKAWLFGSTAVLLAAGGWFLFRPGRVCPVDPVLARACETADRWNRRLWLTALAIWAIGAFMAWLWLPLQKFIES